MSNKIDDTDGNGENDVSRVRPATSFEQIIRSGTEILLSAGRLMLYLCCAFIFPNKWII